MSEGTSEMKTATNRNGEMRQAGAAALVLGVMIGGIGWALAWMNFEAREKPRAERAALEQVSRELLRGDYQLRGPSPLLITGAANVIDGDTLDLDGVRVRLWKVDAFEAAQFCADEYGTRYPCGAAARDFLAGLVKGQAVSCFDMGERSYGRLVARCAVGETDLGAAIVVNGHGLASWRSLYSKLEKNAKRDRRGAWSGAFTAPWIYRGTDQ